MIKQHLLPGVLAVVFGAACGGSKPAPVPTPVALDEPRPTEPVKVADAPSTPAAAMPPSAASDQRFLTTCRGLLEQGKAQVAVVIDVKDQRTVANTLEPFNELSRFVANAGNMAGLAHEVNPDAKVRDAARTCEQEISQFISQLLLDRRVFDAIKGVDVSKEDADTQRFVMTTLRDYKRAGVALPDNQRARIKEIDDAMTKLSQDHAKNIAEDTRYLEVPAGDVKRLDGMPADWIAAHKPDNGMIKISTDYPDYIPFVTYANDDDLRKQLYIKFRTRGDAHNEEVLQKLLVLRAEKAKLLGFANWADYQSDDKMLRGDKNAAAFIARITALAKKRSAKDYAELLAHLKKHDPKATSVGDWQKAWLENQIKKDAYAVDSNEVRSYFPFEQTVAGLLSITSTIYDIQYQPITNALVWHPSVKVYDVMRGPEKLGRIYLDLHPRADKYKHAAQFGMIDGVTGKQLPEGALICNFPDPADGGPALMDHGDVVTMFHEFGHLMHHVLGGKHHWIAQSGVSTERDFVEAPSQMFEEWGWSYDTLSKFAKHYKTGAIIPKDLVAKMRKAEKFGLGTQTVQQVFYAAIALQFHQVDPAKLDQLAMVKKLQKQYTPFAYVAGTKFHTSFGHLVGYSSMYYTYLWSLVIAKDLLTPFEKTGLLDTAVTARYRDKILAPGGSKPAAELVKDFLGRPYNFKAYEKFLGE